MSPRTGWVWVARALVASAACVLLAVGAHALGGGVVAAADPFLLTGMALPLALAATRVRWSTGRAVAALGVGQVLVHALLGVLHDPARQQAGHGLGPVGGSAGGHAGGVHTSGVHASAHDLGVLALVRDGSPAHAAGHGGTTTSTTMLLAHLLAVVVTALVLAHAEDVLWRTLRRLLPVPVRPWTPGHLAPPAHDVASFVARCAVAATRQRGPPSTVPA